MESLRPWVCHVSELGIPLKKTQSGFKNEKHRGNLGANKKKRDTHQASQWVVYIVYPPGNDCISHP